MNRFVRLSLALAAMVPFAPRASFAAPKKPGHAAKPAAGDDGPDILLSPIASAVQGQGVVIDADIADRDGVFEPKLFFRAIGETKYLSIGMVQVGDGHMYRAEIPGTSVTGPMEYFVEAYDGQGNGPARSAPPTRPHKLFVEPPDPMKGLPPPPPADAFLVPAPPPADVPAPRINVTTTGARAPDIFHTPPISAASGRSVPIEASFAGPSGVFNPTLYYRRIGTPGFVTLNMVELPASAAVPKVPGVIASSTGSGRYVAEIPGAITTGDVEYYLEALDSQGNGPARSGDREHPHVIRIVDMGATTIDPDVALVQCRDVPREGDTGDLAKLGPCRAVPDGLAPEAITKYNLGELKLRYDNYADAVSLFQDAVGFATRWPAAYFRLAQAAEAKHEWATAKDAYARYLALAPKPPELPALLKRVASVDYELDLEARDKREAEARAVAEKQKEADRAAQRAKDEAAEEAKVQREMVLSSAASWGFLAGSVETLKGSGQQETLNGIALDFRFKSEGAPVLFFGVGVSAAIAGSPDTSRSDAVLSVSPLLGLNFLAIPAPRKSHFTILSPWVAYQPRIVLSGKLHANADGPFLSRVVVGNHFEFGNWAIDPAIDFGVGQSVQAGGLTIAIGRRLGADK